MIIGKSPKICHYLGLHWSQPWCPKTNSSTSISTFISMYKSWKRIWILPFNPAFSRYLLKTVTCLLIFPPKIENFSKSVDFGAGLHSTSEEKDKSVNKFVSNLLQQAKSEKPLLKFYKIDLKTWKHSKILVFSQETTTYLNYESCLWRKQEEIFASFFLFPEKFAVLDCILICTKTNIRSSAVISEWKTKKISSVVIMSSDLVFSMSEATLQNSCNWMFWKVFSSSVVVTFSFGNALESIFFCCHSKWPFSGRDSFEHNFFPQQKSVEQCINNGGILLVRKFSDGLFSIRFSIFFTWMGL